MPAINPYDDTRRRFLQRQVEQIRDTARERVVEVVIKVRSDEDRGDAFLGTVAEALKRRGLSSSSRDQLPVARGRLERASAAAGSKRALQREDRSLAAQVVSSSTLDTDGYRAKAQAALSSFLATDSVRAAVAAVSAVPARQKPQPAEPQHFWTSSSACLQVRDDDLQSLVANNDIEGIYLNQRLFTPPVVTPKSLPSAIEDNKVSSWGLRSIGALSTWGAFGCRGEGVTVGLLDTGVDATHPDLQGKIAAWAEFDRNGAQVPGSQPHDSDRHGTHCAGTICGGDASGRWIGVAPEAKIAAGLVLNGRQGGTHAQILAGMEWAINQRVDVISMSLGGLVLDAEAPSTYTRAIISALKVGIPVVTAIGNEGSQTTGTPGNDILAFAVGATDHLNRAAGFSGGRTQVIRQSVFFPPDQLPLVYSKPDVSGPGVAIFSSIPGGGWEHFNGTSMATPHVAGAIALLLSGTRIKQDVPVAQRAFVIQDLLTGSAEEMGEAGQNHRFGFGRIDILRALGFARELGYA
jgi:subtilisin family serine protease